MSQINRAVVLGHTGFLGRVLLRHLEQRGIPVAGFSSASLDLRRPDSLAILDPQVDGATLFVASALTPDRGQTLAALADNVAMSLNLGRYLETHPPAAVVYFSSDAVYPFTDHPIVETSPVDPSTIYALAKYSGERILDQAARTGQFRLLVLRPTGIFGPGDTHSSYGPNRFVKQAVVDRSIRLFGAGEETRDHIFVDDAARLAVELAERDAAGVYNLATGVSPSFASIVDELQMMSPDRIEVVNQPRSGPITHRRFDVSKLRETVGEPRLTDFRTALARTFEAAQSNRLLTS